MLFQVEAQGATADAAVRLFCRQFEGDTEGRDYADAIVRDAYTRYDEREAERRIVERYRVVVEVLPADAPPPPPGRPGLLAPLRGPPRREVDLDDGRWVLVTFDHPPPVGGPMAIAAVALLAVSLALLAWLRPLDRALSELVDAAGRLGQRDLSVRVREVADAPTEALAVAFNQMAARIQGLVQTQEDLLAGVSHELRTPLMRLRFAVEMLPTDARSAPRIEEIQRDISELDALIGELLSFARLRGVDDVDLSSLSARELLDEVAADTRRITERPVEVDGDARFTGDRRLVLRALHNLATNAVRYGLGTIRLVASDGPSVVLTVEDEGPGIPVEDRARVVEPFVRLDPSRANGGLGLGLALVARIAGLHHGRLEIGERPSGGARISLVVPR
jgi:signal transduction histidine kinase